MKKQNRISGSEGGGKFSGKRRNKPDKGLMDKKVTLANKKIPGSKVGQSNKENRTDSDTTEILSGIHPVKEAIKAGKRKIYKIFISKTGTNKRIKKIIRSAEQASIPVEFTDSESLDIITDNARHQSIAAKVSPFSVIRIKDVMRQIKNNPDNIFILIIENLEDPHNLGALIRTALCAGVNFIFIPKDRSVAPMPSVSKASAGAMEYASISLITNTVSIIKRLKNNGFWIAGLDADGNSSLFQADLTGNICLIVGGEHKGLRPLVKKECDFLLSLPMEGNINSLNASVAGGIAMYEALRQRSILKKN